MKKFGIDISRWQGDFNMLQAKREGIEFVIIKGGGGDDGLYVDSKFKQNYDNAKRLGLPVGCYWFSKALTVDQAKMEAEYFYQNVLRGRRFELPIYMDVENKTQLAVGQRMLTDIVKTWLEYLENRGYFVGIYSSLYYVNRKFYDSELQEYTHWIAQWNTELEYAHKDICGMWQFGGETNYIRSNKIAGVTCDQDYMLQDLPTMIKNGGFNGFPKPVHPVEDPLAGKTDEELAHEVIAGKYGNGQDRVKALGHRYEAVQDLVNKILAKAHDPLAGKTDEQLAEEVLQGKYGNGEERKQALGSRYDAVQKIVNKLLAQDSYEIYVVKKGDTLSGIAAKYGTTYRKIAADNKLTDPNLIHVGQKLKIYR